ncbi:hypothetical protein GIB67_021975 [Kingdonia uniflora]|uniref:D-isomer specific 2-hydroxyacid dehydrogenase NAD-binding domain-containing protein n=1 Tax=Kingdonia uniflora TaxID=39325 RepID=A0A7J7P7S0_9MAGN|nr:hypothetical protein GIB67_021975 [Kingdonia uniflora]
MKTYKDDVTDKARPDGCIEKGYLLQKALTYCTKYKGRGNSTILKKLEMSLDGSVIPKFLDDINNENVDDSGPIGSSSQFFYMAHHNEMEAKFFEERATLEAKYQKLYESFYTKRYDIVNGVIEVEGVTDEASKEQEEDKATEATIMAKPVSIEVWNPNGKYRVISTKPIPTIRWIRLLTDQDCRVELTEDWGEVLFSALSKAGGKAFSNMAVEYNNVDVNAAPKYEVSIGNTPGVLTETTAELAASLSLAAARRIVEADEFMRVGLYDGWIPHPFVGNLLKGQIVGVIGASRIGSAYARMMIEGFKMNLIYYDLYQATRLEKFVTGYGEFLKSNCFPVYLDSHALYYDSKLQVLVSY